MLLAKHQLDNEAGVVKTPCGSIVATHSEFSQDKVLIIDTKEFYDKEIEEKYCLASSSRSEPKL